MLSIVLTLLLASPPNLSPGPGPLIDALWLIQAKGTESVHLVNDDQMIKARIAKAIAGDGVIRFEEIKQLIDKPQFLNMTNQQNEITSDQLRSISESTAPSSRRQLNAQISSHLDYLTTTFDMLDQSHVDSADQLSKWITQQYRAHKEVHVIIVCTGNSRRSMLGACMGNAAAIYYGLDKLHFHSGGTAPSAFNSRTIAALTDIGFDISAIGQEAPRGDAKTANPIYQVSWGDKLACQEFSKLYSDPINPQSGFAAIMVCSEADDSCPSVKGAAKRLSMPFLDPKMYDGSPFEKAKYAERRDDIARTFLVALCQTRRMLNHTEPSP